MKEAPFDEMRRIIREEEPPRPSTRLSSLSLRERAGVRVQGSDVRAESAEVSAPTATANAHLASTIADRRRIDPRHLSRLFQRELDWIVMKCLEKDRNRRYETAGSLVADVEHYLANEPVQACPPSAAYRIRKLAQRNIIVLSTATFVLSALILGTAIATWQAVRAVRRAASEDQ